MTRSDQINALIAAQGACDPTAEGAAIRMLMHGPRANRRRESLEAAFVERVAFGLTPCWHWTGSLDDTGYGIFASSRNYGCPEVKAHRISWHLHFGPVPAGLKVLHRCDVRACVNPEHLFIGTQADNVADMVAKGRNRTGNASGERNGQARLTSELVARIRAEHAAGASQHDLATKYGVNVMTINRAVRGISWSQQ